MGGVTTVLPPPAPGPVEPGTGSGTGVGFGGGGGKGNGDAAPNLQRSMALKVIPAKGLIKMGGIGTSPCRTAAVVWLS